MTLKTDIPEALMVSGDDAIRKLLAQKDAVVIPAFACRFDGFVNDTFTEYANPSIYRPTSVCRARLVSTLSDTINKAGNYHLGFVMYTAAGQDEPIDIHIGHRRVARARNPDPDNRLHLFFVPERFPFKGGEPIRLVTGETTGPCRIENLVLLPKKPPVAKPKLAILSPHADVRDTEEGPIAHITWIASRPASGQLRWGAGQTPDQTIPLPHPCTNGEVVLTGLEPKRAYAYEIALSDRTGALQATYKGRFRTSASLPQSRLKKARMPILLRRPGGEWPVSVGAPFAKGALGRANQVRLLCNNRPVPVQVRALTHWDDGSVKWALLDFIADGQSDYALEYGRDVKNPVPDEPLDIVASDDGVTVTTGPLRLECHPNRLALPGIVSLRQADGTYRWITPGQIAPAIALTDADGQVFQTDKPDAIVLEEAGSERACIRIECTHRANARARFRSIFRIHLFRNSSLIRVQHTFENDIIGEPFTTIQDLSLQADFDLGAGIAGQIDGQSVDLSRSPNLMQTHDDAFALFQSGKPVRKGRRAAGFAHLSGASASVSFAARDFWQNYPKGLNIDARGIAFQICPPLPKGLYPAEGELEDRLYYHLRDGRYTFKSGVSRTHECWFLIQQGSAPASDAFAQTAQHPPLYSIALDDFNKSQTVTVLPPKKPSPHPQYETWVEAAKTAYAEDRESSRAYGFHNFGDWFGERTYNWGNMEYDTPWCFLQEYLRGGDPQFFTWAEEATRHLIDIDTCHHGPHAGWQYTHCVGHVGGYYPDGYRERAIFQGSWKPSHTWVEGPLLYHLLSGDARTLEGAMKTCALLVGDIVNDYDFTNCRNSGWHLIHLAAAYKTTGRRVFLNAARIIVDRVLERQRPSGGWERLMVPGHCYCHPPRHMGNAGFMVGVLMVGLKRYHEATKDKRVADAIVNAADYCIDAMWVPKTRSFRYTSCPESSVGKSADMRILKGIAYAYGFSKKKRFKDVLEAGIKTALGHPPRAHRGVGKSISSPMRGATQVLVHLPARARKRSKK